MKTFYLVIISFILVFSPQVMAQQGSGNILFTTDDDDMDLGDPVDSGPKVSDEEKALRLRKIVQSATKGETTVQEAPAVITIITEDDIKDYGFRNIFDLMAFVPSILVANGQYDTMPVITTSGQTQSILLLRDGISLFDPIFNVQPTMRRWPLELFKRVEVMSSPGGVLWGANSYLGIASLITKDANDVDGVQMGIGGGTGPGDQDVFRAWGMFGKSYGNLKVFLHFSGEFFRGPKYEYLPLRLYAAPPQPLAPLQYNYDQELSSSTPMNFFGNFNGKVTWKQFQLLWSLPFIGIPGMANTNLASPLSMVSGWPVRNNDSVNSLRQNNFNWYDRFAALKFSDKALDDKLGIEGKAYFTQFVRDMVPMLALPAVENAFNGLAFKANIRAQRVGANIDFNLGITKNTRILFGAESFYEWISDSFATMIAPLDNNGNLDYGALPMLCPYNDVNGNGIPVYDANNPANTTYTKGCRQPMIYAQNRLVAGTFLNLQHKFSNRIIVDGGLRVQFAPAGNITYSPILLPGAAVVIPLGKNWFWKLNYLTGFRAPIFFNTGANGNTVAFGGSPDMEFEKSQAFQTELNSILIKNKGMIQELSFRINYSHILLENFIRINQGSYYNGGDRWVDTVEALARLYLRGGHSVFAGYTFNNGYASSFVDGMMFRSVPNQWFSLASVFRLSRKLDFISSIRVIGSYEDPNRVTDDNNSSKASWVAYEMVPSAAILSAGVRYKTTIGGHKAEFSLMTYNLMDTKSYYTADYFNDPTANSETVPTKGQRFYLFANTQFYF
ncbi:TonB-dependent receptor [Myxococcota bacterium]|nr:TonB-dependent receptor [Myxococcota bacterium]MBU1381102.1 TonB-dependent receptor [Myxococcota bacterium]MBU1498227.1 TonB-dependent receptor [Myxococcota bacterium]